MFIGDVRESRKAEARVVWIATIAALGAALPFQVLNCCQGLGGLSRLVIRFSSLEPADFSLPVIRHGLFSPSPNRSNISSVCRHSPTFPNATLASGFSKEARPHSPFPTRDSTFPLSPWAIPLAAALGGAASISGPIRAFSAS